MEPKEHYSMFGYAVFRDQLSGRLLSKLSEDYAKVSEFSFQKDPHFWSYRHVSLQSDNFQSLALRGYFPKLACELIGVPSVRLLFDQYIVKPAGAPGTPWHQDQPSLCFETYGICTFWIPLVKIEPGFGGIQFFHTDEKPAGPLEGIGLRTETTRKGLSAESVPLGLGSFTVHDGWTIHRAEANSSQSDRLAINLVYFDAEARIEALTGRDWKASRDKFFPGHELGELADNCPIAQ